MWRVAGIGGGCGQNRGASRPAEYRRGAEVATASLGTPAPKPAAEAPPAAPADAPLGPPSATPSARFGAGETTGEPGTPARQKSRPLLHRRSICRHGTHQVPLGAEVAPASRHACPRAEAPPSAAGSAAHAERAAASGAWRARHGGAGMGAIRQGAGRELRRRSSGGRARWSAARAGAIQQCRGRRLRRRSSGVRARWNATCTGAVCQCSGR